MVNPACITLPSSDAALTLVRGDVVRGLVGSVGSTLVRAGLCAAGLYVVGERKELVKKSLAAAISIEVFVLGWVAFREAQSRQASSSNHSGQSGQSGQNNLTAGAPGSALGPQVA